MTSTKLRKIGFCGADDSVSPSALGMIFRSYPFVEFGVLFRPDKEGEPRYASKKWLVELSAVASSSSMTLAAHLCGERVNEVLDGDDSFISTLHSMGFRRVQINATAVNGVDTSHLAESVQNVLSIVDMHVNLEFIIQKNDETKPLWEGIVRLDGNVTMLVDESKGTGLLPNSWPTPPKEYKIGYAGGIGPDNISTVLNEVMIAGSGSEIWIDMESSLRTLDNNGNDIFDLNKCMRCIDAVCESGIYEHPSYLSR